MWETYEIVEPATQEFLVRNLLCLQESFIFETDTTMTCSELWGHAFASHVECYVASGACDLPTTDLVKIFTAIDDQDVGSPEQNAATEAIWDQCWGWRLCSPKRNVKPQRLLSALIRPVCHVPSRVDPQVNLNRTHWCAVPNSNPCPYS
jgi:hypothetical protein